MVGVPHRPLLPSLPTGSHLARENPSPVSLFWGAPIWWSWALIRPQVDKFVPQPPHANLRIVGEAECGRSRLPPVMIGCRRSLQMSLLGALGPTVQGHLAHKKQRPPRTLLQDYAQGLMEALGGGSVSCERGTPVGSQHHMQPLGPLP